ncbi:MAG: ABC transporter ATP-binding protein/permease [Clostridiales bacterium]|nr:ABC transporter ATP-binding protein/permease [Clostridiales bacterium]
MNGKFGEFLSYYKPYKRVLAADLFFAFLASGVVLAYPLLVNKITGQAIAPEGINSDMLVRISMVFLLLLVVEFVSNFYITYWGHVMGAKMEFDMRNDLFQHLQKLSFSYYDNQKTGQLMSRITTDLFDVTELAHHGPEDVLISIVKIIGSLIILMRVNWMLTLTISAVLPFMVVFAVHCNKLMKTAFRRNRERIADINAQIEDSLSGVRVVKSFANEELEIRKFNVGNSRFVDSKRDSYRAMAVFHSGLGAFISFITILVVIAGAGFIHTGGFDLPRLIMFLLYINTLIEPVRRLINFTEQFQNGAAGFVRFQEIMEISPDIMDGPKAADLQRAEGSVEFDNVSFRYADNLPYILRNVNLSVAPGEYLALVGASGVGKTTLCSLIPRFYEADEGSVKLDGRDIREFTIKSLRDQIGIVQQDVYLFTGTVKDNIRYGKPEAPDEEIVEAAKRANAHDFIMELPEGYDTDIGQRGVKLSGGQKQRLSIARVFLKNPPVLIFDEATSALDNESERIVQESFEKLAKNRTTFVIAHRLSTIKNAKRIIVLNGDGIAEQGTHEELMGLKGVYAKYYEISAPKFILEKDSPRG